MSLRDVVFANSFMRHDVLYRWVIASVEFVRLWKVDRSQRCLLQSDGPAHAPRNGPDERPSVPSCSP